ncbi:hypothetical protein ACFQ0K_07220 [Nocardioides caeni]|uniref:Uncharacterized protein n=1 Tax=Nocardioides caeni TaxID=574700 RepID=A0A4S8MZH1_9ACTN|nr:hypothetical protein [Nocardioides caeni]THV08878.1 hypothetical protein E9934_18550 [Nocardioides caeni]
MKVPLATGTAVVLVVAVATGSWLALRDDRPRLAPGEIGLTEQFAHFADDDFGAGPSAEVTVPWGRFTIRATGVVEEIPPQCCTDEPRDVRAPKGGGWVGVQVDTPDLTHASIYGFEDFVPLEVAVVADDHRHALPGVSDYLDRNRESWSGSDYTEFVAVADEDAAVRIEVVYDGLTQVLDPETGELDAGRAAELTVGIDAVTRLDSCGKERWSAPYAPLRATDDGTNSLSQVCQLSYVRQPYHPGKGWAPEGTEWLLVSPAMSAPVRWTLRDDLPDESADAPAFRHDIDEEDVTFTGRLLLDGDEGDDLDGVLVFAVPTGERVALEGEFHFTGHDLRTGELVSARVTSVVHLPGLPR